MSPIVEMGVDFNLAQKQAELATAPAPTSVYTLQVTSVEAGVSKKGRGRLMWMLQIVNAVDPSLNGKKVSYFTNIPTHDDMTGVGFVVQLTKALGKPWNGTTLNTDEYLGLTATANVGVSPDGKWNNIISFV